jgi:hypothetical protein
MAGFGDDLRRFADKAERRLDYVARGTALVGLTSIVQATPVDEGTARGSWQLTFDAPAAGNVERLDPTGNLTINDGTNRLQAKTSVGGSSIYVVSNLPYIVRLEQGHSKQGSHMVQNFVNAFDSVVMDLAREAERAIP